MLELPDAIMPLMKVIPTGFSVKRFITPVVLSFHSARAGENFYEIAYVATDGVSFPKKAKENEGEQWPMR